MTNDCLSCKKDQLAKLLETMDVPVMRKTDYRWLYRNLFIRNGGHPLYKQAEKVLIAILKE